MRVEGRWSVPIANQASQRPHRERLVPDQNQGKEFLYAVDRAHASSRRALRESGMKLCAHEQIICKRGTSGCAPFWTRCSSLLPIPRRGSFRNVFPASDAVTMATVSSRPCRRPRMRCSRIASTTVQRRYVQKRCRRLLGLKLCARAELPFAAMLMPTQGETVSGSQVGG